VKIEASGVSQRLPPEVIQSVVRESYGRFYQCYRQGVMRNPKLKGRVSVRFVIGRDGSVATVMNAGSDLPDDSVVECIIKA
jgi:outer membrane biosynthesis protein TonB